MMKKLLLCTKNSQEDSNGAAHCEEDNEEDSDDADVIVEHQENPHSLKSFCRQVETLENLNFNYDVIVKFVKQGNTTGPITLGRLVSNFNYCRGLGCQSLQSDPCWNVRVYII